MVFGRAACFLDDATVSCVLGVVLLGGLGTGVRSRGGCA